MAETSGFFPSVDDDRLYTADFLAKWIASIIGNGIYDGDLAITADGSAMSVTVPAGRAWINGYHYHNGGGLALPIDNADGVLNRIDVVVLRWDINERSITAQIVKGTPASTATAPAITRSVEQYDLKLAEVSIPAGTTAITQALITDTRLNNEVCGIVTGVVKQVDTSKLYQQIQSDLASFKTGSEADFTSWNTMQKADFAEWLQTMKDIPPEDAAAYLQNQIDAINTTLSGKSGKSTLVPATLSAANWTGDAAPYIQTISVSGVTATSANEVLPGASITADQLEVFQDANIQDGGQEAGKITLLAFGDKPTIDLPVRVIVRGDL